MKRSALKTALFTPLRVAAVGTLLLAGCVYPEREVYSEPGGPVVETSAGIAVDVAPPAPLVEVQTVSPGPGYVWIGAGGRWATIDGIGTTVIGLARRITVRYGCLTNTLSTVANAPLCVGIGNKTCEVRPDAAKLCFAAPGITALS